MVGRRFASGRSVDVRVNIVSSGVTGGGGEETAWPASISVLAIGKVGSDTKRFRQVTRGGDGATTASVACREGGKDTRRHPRLDRGLVPGIAAAAAPGIVDDLGPLVGVTGGVARIVADGAGSQHPIGTAKEGYFAAVGRVVTAHAGDPLRARGYADLFTQVRCFTGH